MEETKPKPFVFVLMPFASEFDDLYQLGIKACCAEAGAYCERVDETYFDEGIVSRIYNQISKADIIVAEMTGRNPNVFYEVGYAHALGKRVILLTTSAQDIPFDLIQYSHIVHRGRIVDLKAGLQKRLEWCIANPAKSLAQAETYLKIFHGDLEITTDTVLEMSVSTYSFGLTLHNPTHRTYPAGSLLVGLVTHRSFRTCFQDPGERGTGSYADSVWLPDGRTLHLFTWLSQTIFPSAWMHTNLGLNPIPQTGGVYDFVFRFFNELGARDLPFRINFC